MSNLTHLPSYQNAVDGGEGSQMIDDVDTYGLDRKRSQSEASISSPSSQRASVASSGSEVRSRKKNDSSRWHKVKRRLSVQGTPALGRFFGSLMASASEVGGENEVGVDIVPQPVEPSIAGTTHMGPGSPSEEEVSDTIQVNASSNCKDRPSEGYGTYVSVPSPKFGQKTGEQYVSLSILRRSREFDQEEHGLFESMMEGFWAVMAGVSESFVLLRLPVYVFVVLCMSALYFVVTGVQFWGTAYMMVALGAPQVITAAATKKCCFAVFLFTISISHHFSYFLQYEANLLFVATSATAPILGVLFGGWLIDRLGGYRGTVQCANALQVCFYLGLFAAGFGFAAAFARNARTLAFFLWFTLFFGGSICPAATGNAIPKNYDFYLCNATFKFLGHGHGALFVFNCVCFLTGIMIASVPRDMRPQGASASLMAFNFFGYMLAPIISGYVMEAVRSASCDEICSMKIGFRVVLFWSVWAVFFLAIALYKALNDAKEITEVAPWTGQNDLASHAPHKPTPVTDDGEEIASESDSLLEAYSCVH